MEYSRRKFLTTLAAGSLRTALDPLGAHPGILCEASTASPSIPPLGDYPSAR